MTGSRRWQLREATAAAHKTVDAAVGSFRDLEGYKAYLAASLRFREPIEAALATAAWPAAFGDWRPVSVAPLIRADMADLNVAAAGTEPMSAPPGTPQLLGTLYVLEGSVLGARVLLERATRLGLSETYGARHLAVLSRDLDGWRTFLALLEATEPFDLENATAASLSTFAAAENAYRRMTHG